jgi:hypothetical protein
MSLREIVAEGEEVKRKVDSRIRTGVQHTFRDKLDVSSGNSTYSPVMSCMDIMLKIQLDNAVLRHVENAIRSSARTTIERAMLRPLFTSVVRSSVLRSLCL